MTETETQLTETVGPSISRRTFLRSTGAATGAATVGVGSDHLGISPVGDAEAIVPIVVGAGAAVSTGWALREYEILGSDDPPEGLTPEALVETVYESARTRESNVQSTFVDNLNLLDGAEHVAYGDGKIGAIESINEQESQSEVEDSGIAATNEYATTVKTNFLESWNETAREYVNLYSTMQEHDDVDHMDVLIDGSVIYYNTSTGESSPETVDVVTETEQIELPNGDTFDLERLKFIGEWSDETMESWFHPLDSDEEYEDNRGVNGGHGGYEDWEIPVAHPEQDYYHYLDRTDWTEVWDSMTQTFDSVRDGLLLWVDGVYEDVQEGDLDPEELLTPRELAEMTADEEDFNQAVADLMALNVAVDLEREAEIYLPHVDATLTGSIARTGEGTLETGTYDPDTEDEDYYLTYDVSMGEGEWDAYESGIDGGIVSFTTEPWEESLFQIETTSGETAEVETTDFEHDDTDDVWTVDISGQLDDSITEIEEVRYYSTIEDTQYETILLDEEFEIVTFTDSDGNEHDSADFTQSEPQSDDNYISEEEWTEMQERHEELIEDYEDAQSGGGGLPFDPNDWSIGPIPGGGVIGGIAVLVLIVLGALNPAN